MSQNCVASHRTVTNLIDSHCANVTLFFIQVPLYLVNCANQSLVSHHDNISDPPPDSFWSYRATDSAFMADGLPVWLARRSGIPCRTACGI